MSAHLLFAAASTNYAVQTGHVKAVHSSLQCRPVAGTRDWFLGLALSQGKLVPVTDLGSFANSEPSVGSSIELHMSVAQVALRVDSIAGASNAQVGLLSSDRDAHGGKALEEFITGEIVGDKGATHYVLDIEALVRSERFNNIKETVG